MSTPYLRLGTFGFLGIFGVLFGSGCEKQRPAPASEPRPVDAPPAATKSVPAGAISQVAELYSSEGCSSCPPADRLAGELLRDAQASGAGLLLLSFQVDYWDRLGWVDPFAAPFATERQRQWAQANHQRGVYTPQMVINGKHGFVGSRRAAAKGHLSASAGKSLPVTIRIQPLPNKRSVRITLAPAPPAGELHLGLLQSQGVSVAKAGENRGRRLVHRNLVRHWQPLALRANQDVELPEAAFKWGAGSVVALLEKPNRQGVLGAAALGSEKLTSPLGWAA